jgi:putative heme iron utilization protein
MTELGMDLAVETPSGSQAVRIAFDHRLADSDDARATLIAMARLAH